MNDRIVIRDNMTLGEDEDGNDIRVVNGDTGTITRFQPHNDPKRRGPQYVVIKLDDGRFIQFPGDSLKDLQHSYAATVHMAQGSEYKDVMLVMTPGQASFMNANMFLTGASRAREGLWIYGDDAELRRIAATKLPPGTRRWWSASTRSSPRRSATSTTPARKGIGPRAEQTMAAHAQIAVRTAYDPAATNGFAVLGASISEGRLAALIARDRFVEVVNQDGVRLQLSFDLNRETLVCERLAPDAAPWSTA